MMTMMTRLKVVAAAALSFTFALGASTSLSSALAADTEAAEQVRDVSGFDNIQLKGSMDVYFEPAGDHSVRVVADGDVIDDIETSLRGDTLVIRIREGVRWRNKRIKRMDVFVTAPDLEGLHVQGSGDIEAKNVEASSFDVHVQGSGDVMMPDASFDSIDVSVQGSGDVMLEGQCTAIEVSVQGSGDVDADDLECVDADVRIQGSGDVVVYAKNSAKASIRGSGDVVIEGAPKMVDRSVRGSGDITVRSDR